MALKKEKGWSKSASNKYSNAVALANKRKGEVMNNVTIWGVPIDLSQSKKLSVSASQLFTIMLTKWNSQTGYQNNPVISLDVAEYLELKGIKDTPNTRKNASRTIRTLIDEIYSASIIVGDIEKGAKCRVLDTYSWNNRPMWDKKGSIYNIHLSKPFFKLFKSRTNNFALPIPLKLFQINTNRNKYAWLIGLYLLQATRQANKSIIVGTLLNSINMKLSDHATRQVITPVIKALDYLKDDLGLIDYQLKKDGEEIDPRTLKGMHLKEFTNCRLYVTWKNYPTKWLTSQK